MKVLDLFSGLGGATKAFQDRGHDIVTLDHEAKFEPDICTDILNVTVAQLQKRGPFDFAWASPPCQRFSVMTIGTNWEDPDTPKTGAARVAQAIVQHTLYLLNRIDTRAWIIENPVGMLRAQRFMRGIERRTVTYCQYGFPYRKATDLWGGFPPTLQLRRPCKPNRPCHAAAPAGSRLGVQGVGEPEEPCHAYSSKRNADGQQSGRHTIRDLADAGNGSTRKKRWRGNFALTSTTPLAKTPHKGARSGEVYHRMLAKAQGTGAPYVSMDELRVAFAEGYNPNAKGIPSHQTKDKAALRALVPYELSLEVCLSMEAWNGASCRRPTLADFSEASP